jgi:ATP-dependent Clp protease adapter protein ClpS
MFRRAKTEERKKLDKEVQAFLLAGGEIVIIPNGQTSWNDNYNIKDFNRHIFQRVKDKKVEKAAESLLTLEYTGHKIEPTTEGL